MDSQRQELTSFVYLLSFETSMKIFLSALYFLFLACYSFAQDKPWSLQQCIEYALKNNIQIKQNMLNEKLSESTSLQSKAQILPSLNGNISHSYSYGRKIDPFTNEFLSGDWTLSQNFSLSTNITIFGGFQNLNTIKQSQYDLMASRFSVDKMRNDVSLNIASAYLQVLFAEELYSNALGQSQITKLQADRTKKLVEVGNLPKGNLFDMEAQLASEELSVVNAENNLSLSKLNLAQMLNLDTVQNFSIIRPEISMPAEAVLNTTATQVYEVALSRQPEIKSAEFKLKSSEKGISIAKGGIYPRLTMSASLGTGFSEASKQLSSPGSYQGYVPNGDTTSSGDLVFSPSFSNPTYEASPFNTQVDNNLNKSFGFYLTVPLFNNLQTHTAISRAKISRENAELTLQLEKNNLRQKIQQAHNDAVAALKKFQASNKAVSAMEESFKYTEQKYNLGAVTATDYNDAKNKLAKAKSDMLQAKYDYVFKLKVLDFYQGKPISL